MKRLVYSGPKADIAIVRDHPHAAPLLNFSGPAVIHHHHVKVAKSLALQ